jgi:hypothetical protein
MRKNKHRWCMRYEWPDGDVTYGTPQRTRSEVWSTAFFPRLNTEKNRRECRRHGIRPVKVTIVEGWR